MRRREFITIVGGAAAWPLPVRAQPQTLPSVGFLSSWTADTNQRFRQAFRDGVKDEGFVEGQNVSIEYRQVEADEYDQCQRWRLTSLLGEWLCFSQPRSRRQWKQRHLLPSFLR